MNEGEHELGGARRATLKQVAQRAGVSINTASVVLNPRRHHAVVHPDTRARVQEAARALGYRRNLAASRLAGGAANTLCIVMDRMTNQRHAVILDAFVSEATREGFQCMLGCTEPTDAKSLEFIRGLSMQGVDGFVFVPVWTNPAIADLMPGLLEEALKTLFIDDRFPGSTAPLVACDHRAGGRALAEHLTTKGHRRVFYVSTNAAAPAWAIQDRIAGAREALAAAGGALDVVTAAEDVTSAVWDRLQGGEPPTAVMCADDFVARALIAGLNGAGLDVAGKIAITGYDDVGSYLPLAGGPDASWNLPLTTFRQPMEQIGQRAARELIAMTHGTGPAPNTDLLLPGELVARQSTAHTV